VEYNMKIAIWPTVAMTLFLAGCAQGPGFKRIEEFPLDRALVYFYRPEASVASGQNYSIKMIETVLGKLSSGTYFTYIAVPGPQTYYYEGRYGFTKVSVDLAPGGTYYFRLRRTGFLGSSFKLEQVHPMVGQVEIMECRLYR